MMYISVCEYFFSFFLFQKAEFVDTVRPHCDEVRALRPQYTIGSREIVYDRPMSMRKSPWAYLMLMKKNQMANRNFKSVAPE